MSLSLKVAHMRHMWWKIITTQFAYTYITGLKHVIYIYIYYVYIYVCVFICLSVGFCSFSIYSYSHWGNGLDIMSMQFVSISEEANGTLDEKHPHGLCSDIMCLLADIYDECRHNPWVLLGFYLFENKNCINRGDFYLSLECKSNPRVLSRFTLLMTKIVSNVGLFIPGYPKKCSHSSCLESFVVVRCLVIYVSGIL